MILRSVTIVIVLCLIEQFCVFSLCGSTGVASDGVKAGSSNKTPFERMLDEPNAAKASELYDLMVAADRNRDFEAAIKHGQELLELRTRLQGADHWQAVSVKFELEVIRRMQGLKPDLQKSIRASQLRLADANKRAEQGDAQLLPAALEEMRRKCVEVFGEKHLSTAIIYRRQSEVMAQRRELVPGEALTKKALGLLRDLVGEQHPETLTAYLQLADFFEAQGKLAEAQGHYEQAIKISRALFGEESLKTFGCYERLGSNLSRQTKFEAAHKMLMTTLENAQRKLGEKHSYVARAHVNVASNLINQGKSREAQPYAEKAIEIAREQVGENHELAATCYTTQAFIHYNLENFDESQRLNEMALKIRRERLGENHSETLVSYNNLAMCFRAQGRLSEAQPLLQQTVDTIRKVRGEKDPQLSIAYSNLAANLDSMAQLADAQVLHEKALVIARETKGDSHPDTAMRYGALAANLQYQGKYAEARPMFEKQLEIFRRRLGEDHPNTAGGYENLANNFGALGMFAEAVPLYKTAMELNRKHFGKMHSRTVACYKNYASSLAGLGKVEEARSFLQKTVDTSSQALGDDDPELAQLYIHQGTNLQIAGETDKARPFFEKALAVRRKRLGETHPATADAYGELARNATFLGRHEEALKLGEASLEICRQVFGENHPNTALEYRTLGMNLLAVGKPRDAIDYLQRAADSFETSRIAVGQQGLERSLYSAERSPYEILSATYASLGMAEEAWSAAESNLARGMNDELALRRGFGFTAEQQKRQARIEARLKQINAKVLEYAVQQSPTPAQFEEISQLRNERRDLDLEFTQMAAQQSRRELATLTEVQASLPDDAAIILWIDVQDFRTSVNSHWGCVVRSQGAPAWVPLPGSGAQGRWTNYDFVLAESFRNGFVDIKNEPFDKVVKQANLLFRQRIFPLLKHLDGVRRLYVVPVGQMARIPVELLVDGYIVSYIPSGTSLARLLRKPPPRSEGLLALGDPYFRRRGDQLLASHPGSRITVFQLAKLFGSRARTLVGTSASEQIIDRINKSGELSKYRHLMFYTHGGVNHDQPFETNLALSQDYIPSITIRKPGDPFINAELSAREVLDGWELDAELVTLSACGSSLGRSGGGDGQLGFAQAFLAAGSRSVCLTLWSVYDAPTTLLMLRFYQNLTGVRDKLAAPMPKAEALAEAKSWLRTLPGPEAIRLIDALPQGIDPGSKKELKLGFTDELRKLCEDSTFCPYADGIFWAAFVLVGDPR